MKYLHVWNWTSLGKIIVSRGDYGKMIIFESITQRNALDQCSNNPSSDHVDQWPGKSLSRVDLIDHWSQNGFAPKERHRSEILIRILPGERTRTLFVICNGRPRQDASDPEKFFINSANRNISSPKSAKWRSDKWSSLTFCFSLLSRVILRGFETVNSTLHWCHSKGKGKTQGVQLLGLSGPKVFRTSPNFFRFQMSLNS